ncbi:unnamed protein product [Lathyrus oleraceus]|uniref:LisH domain-containing protein n=1 Tax=Pisum sativum TaxID=3888 RepID=A0A9D4VYE7_PEA|nr:uncharacterized protein LOC127106606 [Pisum sativum]KAI5391931.1 hypothetical protein KIW84_076650 [Pisum sativum]
MAKQSKSKKPESFGKGKVTPIQIAFIVDRYLCDNNFTETRKSFRIEASSFIANSPINEVPKSLMSLGEMLDEYICLKEQKVMLDQERVYMEQEKNRVQMFLNGVQNVMNVYNASKNISLTNVAMPNAKSVAVPQQKIGVPSASAAAATSTSTQNTSNMLSVPQSNNTNVENGNYSTPMISVSDRKRKDTRTVDAPSVAKRSRGRASSTSRKVPVLGQNTLPQSNNAVNNQVVYHPSSATQSSAANFVPSGSQVQGSSVVKCLFNQPQKSIPTNSQVPKTPPRANSSHSDANISPPEVTQVPPSNAETTSTCYTVISTKRVMVSPAKQMAYIESSHCISPVKTNSDKAFKREHVRSRLNFDSSDMPQRLDSDKSLPNEISTTESNNEVQLYDIDFPNFDALSMDFSFAEMLNDLDFSCEGLDFSCDPTPSHSNDNQVISEQPSTSAEALSEKNMNIQGTDSLTAMASVIRNVTILSPEKKHQSCLDQENC